MSPTTNNTSSGRTGGLLAVASGSLIPGSLHFPSIQIPLERTNYSLWRNTIKSDLEAYDLDDLLLSDNAPPQTIPATTDPVTPASSNPEFTAWRKKDRLVLLWVRSTLSQPLLAHVARATTAAEAWNILEKMFYAQTKARMMHLRHQLQTFMKGNLSILDYFEKKSSFSDSLAECSFLVPDEEFVECILHGLDSSFAAFRTAINMKSEPVSSDELLGLLLQEEERHQASLLALQTTQISANYVRRGPNTSRPSNLPDGAGSTSSSAEPHRPRMTCQICQKSGHDALNCWQRYKSDEFPARRRQQRNENRSGPSRGPGRGQRNNASSSHQQQQSAFNVNAPPSQIVDPSWFFDTGATNHVTTDFGNLSVTSEYSGNEGLQVGNGQTGADPPKRHC